MQEKQGLGLFKLTCFAIGTTLASGVFSMFSDIAANGAGTLSVLIGWTIAGAGMYSLAMCFNRLSIVRPNLKSGIFTYAREGFFELCRVAAVNLAVFLLARWYSPKAKKGVRLLLGGLGIETLAFIVLAFSKMWYYIESYHSFTFKRALCCWLLITLFVLFALMVAELWNRQVKGVRTGVLFGCVSFLIMAYSNLPAWAP